MSTLSSTIIHVHKVEKFNWRTVRYFMFTKYKSVTGDIYDTLCPQSGKFNWTALSYSMSTKWKS